MKKTIATILIIFSAVIMLFVSCSDTKDTYVVKQVVIDTNGSSILLDINDKTLSEYPGIAYVIENIGNKNKR